MIVRYLDIYKIQDAAYADDATDYCDLRGKAKW